MSATRVGVLALHGGVAEHRAALRALGSDSCEVRDAAGLERLDGLVLPGGESTTLRLLASRGRLLEALRELVADGLPTLATCAGLIAVADRVEGGDPLIGGLGVTVRRNDYGRQRFSFEAPIDVPALGPPAVPGVFIRAPRIVGSDDGVEVLGALGDDPVLVRQGSLLACAFHPELTDDRRIHRAFVESLIGGVRTEAHVEHTSKGASGVRA